MFPPPITILLSDSPSWPQLLQFFVLYFKDIPQSQICVAHILIDVWPYATAFFNRPATTPLKKENELSYWGVLWGELTEHGWAFGKAMSE